MIISSILLVAMQPMVPQKQVEAKPQINVLGPSTEPNEKKERRVKIRGKWYAMDDIVCKKERVTGSRHKKKICATARQWDLLQLEVDAFETRFLQGVRG